MCLCVFNVSILSVSVILFICSTLAIISVSLKSCKDYLNLLFLRCLRYTNSYISQYNWFSNLFPFLSSQGKILIKMNHSHLSLSLKFDLEDSEHSKNKREGQSQKKKVGKNSNMVKKRKKERIGKVLHCVTCEL